MLFYSIQSGFDYFNVSACQALLEMVHGAFELHVGDFFGNVIVGTFQDELAAMPVWSTGFAEAFQACCDYDVLPHLPVLWEEYGEQAQRVRHDYHSTRSALAEAAFFKPLFQWHEEHGLTCGFRPARSGSRWLSHSGRTTLCGLPSHPPLVHRSWKRSPWRCKNTLLAGSPLRPIRVCGSKPSIVRAGEAPWKRPSTGCCPGYVQAPTYTIPMRRTTALVAGAMGFSVDRLATTVLEALSHVCTDDQPPLFGVASGHHVCDIGVLFPTTTVQAGLSISGFSQDAQVAHDMYLRLVGKMHWYKVEPGVLDRACRDFDVLDDASIQRGEVRDGRLHIGEERYGAIVLPGCSVLEDETAARLVAFVESGGCWWRLVVFHV